MTRGINGPHLRPEELVGALHDRGEVNPDSLRDLPPAMVNYYAARIGPVSKHVDGHRGQKARAKAHRRGTAGAARRRRFLAARKLALVERVRVADAAWRAANPKFSTFCYDESKDFGEANQDR